MSQTPVTGTGDRRPTLSGGRPLPTFPRKQGKERSGHRAEHLTWVWVLSSSGSFLRNGGASRSSTGGSGPSLYGHKSNPAILGPPPSLEMFIGDCVYLAVTARKRSDIITPDQSSPRARGKPGTPPPLSHFRARLHRRAPVAGGGGAFPRTFPII